MDKQKNISSKSLLQMLRGQSPRERLLHRMHCVALVLSGVSASQCGVIFGASARAVAYWVKQFERDGLAGLEEDKRSGRPTKLNAKQMKELQLFMKHSKQAGHEINGQALSKAIVERYGLRVNRTLSWRILRKLRK